MAEPDGNADEQSSGSKKGLRAWLAAGAASVAALAVLVGNIDDISQSGLGRWVASWFSDPGDLSVAFTCEQRRLTVQLSNIGDEPVRLTGEPTFESRVDGQWQPFPMDLIYELQDRNPFTGSEPLESREVRPVRIDHPFDAYFSREQASSGRCGFRVQVPHDGPSSPATADCTCAA